MRLNLAKGYGFIRILDSHDETGVFFHARDLNGLEFDQQLQELVVEFNLVQTPRGLRAAEVRPASY